MSPLSRIIAIDGPAGSGKSTVARAVAQAVGFTYLDTGAMYRAVAFAALDAGVDAAELAAGAAVSFDGGRVLIDGRDVSDAIRSEEISQAASQASARAEVRAALVAAQRRVLATHHTAPPAWPQRRCTRARGWGRWGWPSSALHSC